MQDRPHVRRAPRVRLDCYANKIIGDEPHMVRVRDISTQGVYLYRLIEPKTAVEQRVGIELMLPGSERIIWAVGRVVRQEEEPLLQGSGVHFERLDDVDRRAIENFVCEAQKAA